MTAEKSGSPLADIPTLTDIAPDPDLVAGGETGNALSPADENGKLARATQGEVISRVQTQNLQHSLYQKLKNDLDTHIADVVREQFMPEIGAALNSALQHISDDLKGNISQVVRASLEQALAG